MLGITEAYLTLQSRLACYYFFKGGCKEGGGVFDFNSQVRAIWCAAEQDDPYADLFLLRIYDALITTRREIKEQIQFYQGLIQKEMNLEWQTMTNEESKKIKLNFMLTYAYMAANLIADFDQYVCLLYSAKKLGMVFDQPLIALFERIGAKIKAIFSLAHQWVKTDVTREDVQEKNARAQFAFECMGKLNEQVLRKELRAPFTPKIIKKAPHTTL